MGLQVSNSISSKGVDRYIPISNDGELILENISNIIDDKTKIVSLIHQSNVFGTVNQIEKIISKSCLLLYGSKIPIMV